MCACHSCCSVCTLHSLHPMSTKFQWSLEWELSKTQSKKLVIWLLLWLLIAWRGHPLDCTQNLLATHSSIPRNTNDQEIQPLTYIVCVCLVLSRVRLFATLWTVASRLLCLWDSPGKNTGVGWHFLHQGIFPTQGLNPHLLWLPTEPSGTYVTALYLPTTYCWKWWQRKDRTTRSCNSILHV